jgi:hypothetical protein
MDKRSAEVQRFRALVVNEIRGALISSFFMPFL